MGNYLIKDANYINVKKDKLELVNIYFSADDFGNGKVSISKGHKFGPFPDGTVINDLGGNYAAPAFCDVRCSIGSFSTDLSAPADIVSAEKSGFGIICPTPNTDRNYPETASLLNKYTKVINTVHCPEIIPVAPVLRTGYLGACDIKELMAAGCRLFTDQTSASYIENSTLKEIMKDISEGDGLLICSCHDRSLIGNGVVNNGTASAKTGLPGIPPSAELLSIMRNIILSAETGCRIHISGISLGDSVKMIRRAKDDGVRVTCSVAPPYFCFKEDELLYRGAMAKLMPPLRTAEDVSAVIQGLNDGTIDCIESGHCPVNTASKKDIEKGSFGSVGFETAFSAGMTYLVNREKLSVFKLIELMSVRPFEIIFNKEFEPSDLFTTGMIRLNLSEGSIYSKRTSWLSSGASVFDGAFLSGKAHRII